MEAVDGRWKEEGTFSTEEKHGTGLTVRLE